MENKKLITATTPEGEVVNKIAEYMQSHGAFNVHKIVSMYADAIRNNNIHQLADVESELSKQMLENLKTLALWEQWGM